MSDLSEHRKEIDEIDRELVRLLDRRARIARDVGRVKETAGQAVFDPGRHRAVIERAVAMSDGSFPAEGLRLVMREILSVSLALQKQLRAAYLGPEGTFAHQAAVIEFGTSVDFEPCEGIPDIFRAVSQGRTDYGIVPIENSTGGMVHASLDALVDCESSICHEIYLPIQHSLIGNVPLQDVKRIYSHPQTFFQCHLWLQEHLPKVELIELSSTVAGIKRAKEEPHAAAIGSHLAAIQYGLQVIVQGIEDNPDNTTRFLVIAKNDAPPTGDDKTSIMFYIKDRPGALFDLLQPFATRGINLCKIESRPTKKRAWDYIFFVDLLGHRKDEPVGAALKELEGSCQWLRLLGSYPRFKETRNK